MSAISPVSPMKSTSPGLHRVACLFRHRGVKFCRAGNAPLQAAAPRASPSQDALLAELKARERTACRALPDEPGLLRPTRHMLPQNPSLHGLSDSTCADGGTHGRSEKSRADRSWRASQAAANV